MKISGLSKDIEQTEREKLASVFPQCFVEGKLDIDKLLSLCGEYILKDFEKYEFTWKGKSQCLPLAQQRSTATLRPCAEESVNFETTQNLYIEGDNLEVLKLLQTSYFRRVKMIYIDPPYNTGNDFVYEDDFKDPLERYREVTSQTTKSNPEAMGRFHTNWLNMMYPRLRLAANLLRDDGVIFISIDDGEQANLRKMCDEVFGEENFTGQFPWRKRTAKSDVPFGISQDYEWVLCYAKSDKFVACIEGGTRKYFETDDLPGRPWRIHDLTKQTSASERPNSFFTMVNPKNGDEYPANPNRTWAITKETFDKYYADGRIVFPGDYDFLNISKPALRYFKEDDMAKAGEKFGFMPVSTNLPNEIGMTQDGTKEITELFGNKVFGFPKPTLLAHYFIKIATTTTPNDSDIILDFFSGSATTAHAVMQLNAEDGGNRQFIMVQLPELCPESSEAFKAGYKNICEIGKERIRRAGAKMLENIESTKQNKKQTTKHKEQLSLVPDSDDASSNSPSPDTGFKVFKLDSSNLKIWDSTPFPEDDLLSISNRLHNMIDRIKPDRTDLDVVYEIMHKMGVPLTCSVSQVDISGKTAWSVGDFLLLICLSDGLTVEMIEEMANYAPGQIILAENALPDDTAMSNAYYILRDRNIEVKLV